MDNKGQVTGSGLKAIFLIVFASVVALVYMFLSLNASREIIMSVVIGSISGLLLFALIIFLALSNSGKIRNISDRVVSHKSARKPLLFVCVIITIYGFLYFSGVGTLAFHILKKALKEEDRYAMAAGAIGLIVVGLVILGIVAELINKKNKNR